MPTGTRFKGTRLGWCVNIQEPLRQAPNALRTMDLALDLIVDLDGTQDLKDEAEFHTLCREGLISEQTSEAVRPDLASARRHLTKNKPPFERRGSPLNLTGRARHRHDLMIGM